MQSRDRLGQIIIGLTGLSLCEVMGLFYRDGDGLHDKLIMDRRFPWIFVDTVNNLFGWSLKVKFQES